MRKVTTINLNNNAYQIDEDGYEALRAYLDSAARALASNPDREEILCDLEQAIADKCRLALGPHKTVVSAAEIQRILTEMGPVAGSTDSGTESGDAEQATSTADAEARATRGFLRRRLYRIREGRMWAGICQGLAAYADIDVTLIRVAVVLITFVTGLFPGLIVYLVMCFVIPVASTPEEMTAAHGQPFRAQEVVDRVKKKRDDWRTRRHEKRREKHMNHAWMYSQPANFQAPGYAARVTGGVFLPLLTVLSAVWFSVMATVAYVAWQGWYLMGLSHWPPGIERGYDEIPRWAAMVAIGAVYALLALPIGAARRASLYYANGGRLHGWADAWSGLLWLALVAVLLLAAWYALPQLQDLLQIELDGRRGVISI
ncbi:MAG: PspC domain-containing protein [Pseudomonadota bacterium]